MIKPLACEMALTLFLQLIQSKIIYYFGSVVFIGSNILYSIGYQINGKESYQYIST